jgi:hypothetical protein
MTGRHHAATSQQVAFWQLAVTLVVIWIIAFVVLPVGLGFRSTINSFTLPLATTYYVRTDGGSASQCTGLVNAPYPGSGTGQACGLASLPAAIAAASCGDTIRLKNGQIFDFGSPVALNKSCSASAPLVISTTADGLLPAGRVGPSDAPNMPRLRITQPTALFTTTLGAAYWTLDGLEITDNQTVGLSPYFLDFGETGGTPNHMTVQRCYIHPKEPTGAGGTWFHYVKRAIQFEGSYLTFKWNYAAGFEGFDPGQPGVTDTWEVLLSVGGPGPILYYDNYSEAWYASIFTGGGGGRHNHLTASSNATLSSATVASSASLAAGLNIAVRLKTRGVFNGSSTFTRSSGEAISSVSVATGQFGRGAILHNDTTGVEYVSGTVRNGVSGDTYSVVNPQSAPSGTYTLYTYFAVHVDTLAGNVITYTPYGPDALVQIPVNPVEFVWALDYEQGNVMDITIQKNTFNIAPAFATYMRDNFGGLPKGYWEFKTGKNVLIDGNRFTGFGAAVAMNSFSQAGLAPWITTTNVMVSNNLFAPSLPGGVVFNFQMTDPYHSNSVGSGYIFQNNLVTAGGYENFLQISGGNDYRVYHNTVYNSVASTTYHAFITFTNESPPALVSGLLLRDNIASNRIYGLQCLAGALTNCVSGTTTIRSNAVVDDSGAGVNGNSWGTASILSPIYTSFNSVGFTNSAAGNYRLLSTSAFHNAASDGSDVGVNQDLLEFVQLGGSATPTPTPTPTPSPSPSPSASASPSPSPSPSSTATPTPTPTPNPSPTATPSPSPGSLPTCRPSQLIGSPATCTCTTKAIGPPSARRCR